MAAMTALLIISAASAGIQAIQNVKAGNAAKRAGEASQRASEDQAELAEYNAGVSDLMAHDAELRGQSNEQLLEQQIAQTIGRQRSGIAANGVTVGFGSALEVQQDARRLGEQDVLALRTNTAREAWGYKVQSENDRRQAEILRKEGANAAAVGKQQQAASRWDAAGSIATNGASLLQAKYGARS